MSKRLLSIAAATALFAGAAIAQTSTAPGTPGSGNTSGDGHAKMITDKGYRMTDRMERRGDHTIYHVMRGDKPWHVKVYGDGRMTEHEGNVSN
ncbi:MAG: hypothetical protein ACRCXM_06345 [Beijerinckiaceae bacterium]